MLTTDDLGANRSETSGKSLQPFQERHKKHHVGPSIFEEPQFQVGVSMAEVHGGKTLFGRKSRYPDAFFFPPPIRRLAPEFAAVPQTKPPLRCPSGVPSSPTPRVDRDDSSQIYSYEIVVTPRITQSEYHPTPESPRYLCSHTHSFADRGREGAIAPRQTYATPLRNSFVFADRPKYYEVVISKLSASTLTRLLLSPKKLRIHLSQYPACLSRVLLPVCPTPQCKR